MKKFTLFWVGLICGWLSIVAITVIWIFIIPHTRFENEVDSQLILLENNERILFTSTHDCTDSAASNGFMVLTYIKNDGSWVSREIPEGSVARDDEYVLTTSMDKSHVFILLPQKNMGFAWDLANNDFYPVSHIQSFQFGKEYIHQIP